MTRRLEIWLMTWIGRRWARRAGRPVDVEILFVGDDDRDHLVLRRRCDP